MSLDDVLPYVLPYVNGCPDEVAKHHVLLSAREFAQRTHCWLEQQDAIVADADATEYAFNLSEGQDVTRLVALSVGGRDFDVVNASRGRLMLRSGGFSNFAFTANLVDFTIAPAQAAGALIVTECALRPTLDSVDLDDDAFAEHAVDIGWGAIASLMAMPRQDWSSLDYAGVMRNRFNDSIATLALRLSRGFANDRPRAAAQFF